MTPQQRRGYIYVLLSVLTLVSFDLALKVMLYATGRLRPGQVVGTVLTLVLCYFLWRGSKIAYGVLIACAALSILYGLLMSTLPRYMQLSFIVVAGLLLLAWCAPASRAFLSYQRQRSA
jgi:hypothetical protein